MLCTIPLCCLFIIPLNRKDLEGQVQCRHAWTFSMSVFQNISPKGEQTLIFMAQPARGATVFFVNLWVHMEILELPQTSTAVFAWGRGTFVPPKTLTHTQRWTYMLWKIKNHSLKSHNFLLKHNFLAVHLLLCCREKHMSDCWTTFQHCFGKIKLCSFIFWIGKLHVFFFFFLL